MAKTRLQKMFAPIRAAAPAWVSNPLRSLATALLTPLWFTLRTGHWKSSFRRAAVSSSGRPLPWYTYPAIDFLAQRNYRGRSVLEFGAGQSTLWWASRAERVLALDGKEDWVRRLRPVVPGNVDLHLVPNEPEAACLDAVARVLANAGGGKFDVVVVDGLWRYQLIPTAARVVKDDGIVVCDNAESFGIAEGFRNLGLLRVDFFGHAPGVVLPHCTSIFFRAASFAFDSKHPIPDVARGSIADT